MRIELRLTTAERLQEVLGAPADAVGIGQEGCPHRLPETDEVRRAADAVRCADRSFTLVLPQAWEPFAEQLISTAVTVSDDGPVTVIANDMGTLITLASAGLPTHTTLAAGQGLVYGYAQSPLADQWFADERPDLAAALRAANIADGPTLDLLVGFGVTAVEADAATAAATPATTLTDRGFELRTVMDAAVVGIARACPTARHRGVRPKDACRSVCDVGLYRLKATQKWRLVDAQREPMSRAARQVAGTLAVSGNVVYRPVADAAPDATDVAVIDVRWHTPEQLSEAVTALRDRTPADAATI
jgi:hypothetical protein